MPKSTDPANAERVAKHAELRRQAGLCRVSVWVPEARRGELQRIAMQMRADTERPLPEDKQPETPPLQIPIPTVTKPEAPIVKIRSASEEVWLHMLLKANGAEWHGKAKVWTLRHDVAKRLGLQSRVVP